MGRVLASPDDTAFSWGDDASTIGDYSVYGDNAATIRTVGLQEGEPWGPTHARQRPRSVLSIPTKKDYRIIPLIRPTVEPFAPPTANASRERARGGRGRRSPRVPRGVRDHFTVPYWIARTRIAASVVVVPPTPTLRFRVICPVSSSRDSKVRSKVRFEAPDLNPAPSPRRDRQRMHEDTVCGGAGLGEGGEANQRRQAPGLEAGGGPPRSGPPHPNPLPPRWSALARDDAIRWRGEGTGRSRSHFLRCIPDALRVGVRRVRSKRLDLPITRQCPSSRFRPLSSPRERDKATGVSCRIDRNAVPLLIVVVRPCSRGPAFAPVSGR